MKKMKRFAVIGLGKFGFFVAKSLYEDGKESDILMMLGKSKDIKRIEELK